MSSLLALRFLWSRKLRALLSIGSVALGVALLAALLTLNASMARAVDAQVNRILGTYDLMIGYRKADTRLSQEDLSAIEGEAGVAAVAGILIPYMYESHPELIPSLNYYGVPDNHLGRQFMDLAEGAFPGPGEVAVSAAWAKREGLQIGDRLELGFPPNGPHPVRVSGLLAVNKRVSVGFAIFERTWLEEATSRPGSTFALVELAKGVAPEPLVGRLQERFPEVEYDLRQFRNEMRRNLSALRPVALGMGLASLLASAFLLTASFRISLAERTREMALLRTVGALPGQVRRMVLAEGLLIGAVGAATGTALGVGGALATAEGAARLLGAEPIPPVLPIGSLILAAAGGVLLALLSALGVARVAGKTPPLLALRPDLASDGEGARRGGRFGLILAAAGALLLLATPMVPDATWEGALRPLTGSTGALAVALGLILGAQRLLPLLLPALAAPLHGRAEARLAVRGLLRHRQRSGLSLGALALGLVLLTSIGTLSSSLLGRWHQQVRQEHPADIHLEVPRVFRQGVSPDLAGRVAAIPGITRVAAVGEEAPAILLDYDWSRASAEFLRQMAEMDAKYYSPFTQHRDQLWTSPADLPGLVEIGAYRLVAGSLADWGEGSLAVEQSAAKDRGLRVGDRLRLNVRQGSSSAAFEAQEVREYRVVALVETDSWRMPSLLTAHPFPGASPKLRMLLAQAAPEQREQARREVQALVESMEYNLAEYSDFETATAALRAQTNQRFALLLAVGLIMAAVALMSLINTMVSSVSERKREFAMMRAVGATPTQLRNLILLEAGLLGLSGGLVGLTGGAVLGAGALWGLSLPLAEVRLPWGLGVGSLVGSLVLAVAAALGPARRIAGLPPAKAVRVD